ncbi:MAG: MEDS domain-containing protein [Deltaproteobacteria bacterium]|nr:MEDS domain-containing protein [Deltaproteobacteria bacterium]
MDRSPRPAVMGFTDELFPTGTHMCLIYDHEDERRGVIGRFLDAGLQAREKVAYFADTMAPVEVAAWLRDMGVDVPRQGNAPGFSITVAEKTYCPDGRFAPEAMLSTLRAYHQSVVDQGYPGGRVSGEMSWALRGIPGSDRLMEYEALVNDVLATHPITAVCQYDARRFDGAAIFDVLKVHPMMIVHGRIVRNPYYLQPHEFLQPAR